MKKQIPLILSILICSLISLEAQVVINEFSASNYQFLDNFEEYHDWIEIYNAGNQNENIGGYFLSDDIDDPQKWQFPNGVVLAPGQYLVIWASDRDIDTAPFHTSFKITQTKNSEAVVLSDASGNIIDSNSIDETTKTNHSWARSIDGSGEWQISTNPSPGSANTVDGFYTDEPDIEPKSGYYQGSVEVSIESNDPDARIYYTTDGSEPDETDNLYTGAFMVDETTVIRAAAYNDDSDVLPSFIESNTYFIDIEHSIKIISISGEQIEQLMAGEFIDPVVSIEYFNENGEKLDEAVGECNKHGNDSWLYAQRGIDYITRDQFGYDNDIDDQIFHRKDRTEFQRLILKAAANDNYPFQPGGAHIRDAYVHTLSQIAELNLDERTYEPCVLYINGQYWGVYEIREKVDDNDFTKYYYDQGRKWIDFIKTWGMTWEEYGSWDDWYTLRTFIETNDMTDPANYAFVEEQFELISLIDYVILHAHIVSKDWLNWNTAWWRGRKESGGAKKWRYILWDEDATFGHYINYTEIPDESPNADPCNPELITPDIDFEGHIGIFERLFENEEFLKLYINRYADLNNTYFSCEFMIPLLDSLIANIEPEMDRHIARWGGSKEEWEANVQQLKDFINTRCTIIDEGIVDCYEDDGITGPYSIEIDVEPEGAGRVRANSQILLSYPWDASYYGGIDIELTAIENPDFKFSHWEVQEHVFTPDEFAESINLFPEVDDRIVAVFIPSESCGDPSITNIDSMQASATIDWIGPGNFISYEVQYREIGEMEWNIFSTIDTFFNITELSPCTEYEFRLRSICENVLSEYIELVFSTKCNTSTDDIDNLLTAAIYPNPFSDNVQIDFYLKQSDDVQIELFNQQGQLVHKMDRTNMPSGNSSINLELGESITNGMYILKLTSSNSRYVQQIIKI